MDRTPMSEVREKLKEIEQIKSNLLDVMTHEFSTPISVLKAYIEMFLTRRFDSSNPRCREGLHAMKEAVTRLERLVINLLTLGQGKNKKLSLDYEQVVVQDLITHVLSQLREGLQKKNLTTVLKVSPDFPPIWADPSKLSIAFMNLLDNSIKFNRPYGFIRITLTRSDSRFVGIALSDTGNGISEDKIEEIFNPFTQVDMSSTREYPGIGLGLPVAKVIIEAHGGKIKVHSKRGKGSTFLLVLPCEKPVKDLTSAKKELTER
jgi:two-component system sensor histidine kinase BarA